MVWKGKKDVESRRKGGKGEPHITTLSFSPEGATRKEEKRGGLIESLREEKERDL